MLQGRRLCGSHKYCDPQCVHGCESNQDQPKTGHQVQNFITSSVHKARVSSANRGWIAWLCYPLRKGHPGKRIALAKGQLPRLALEKGCPLKKGVCHKQSLRKDVPCKREIAKINPWERMLLNAKGNPLQKGTATLALELFGHPLGKGKIPALILAKGENPCKRVSCQRPLRKGIPGERTSLEKGSDGANPWERVLILGKG